MRDKSWPYRKEKQVSTIVREVGVPVVPAVLDPRVVRGAELLDERMPGWADRVDVATLDMNCPHNCVLGQTAGWIVARKWPDLATARDVGAHGFLFNDQLQDWRLAILSRRTPA